MINKGTIDFGTNDYFNNCSNCSFVNANAAKLVVNNPDGKLTHVFSVNSGSFDNLGLIIETGYYPGVALTFGTGVIHAGNAEMDNMSSGQTLTSSTGVWDPWLPDSLTYQWQRCTTTSPSTCSQIPGATTNQYVVTDADRGKYLAVYAVGHNDGTALTSSQSQLVLVSTG